MRDVEKLLLDQMAKTSWNFRKLCKFKIFIEYLTLLFAAFSKRSVAVVVCGQPAKLVWSAEMPKDFSIFPYSFSALSFPRSTAGQMPQVDWLADRRTDKQTDRYGDSTRAEANYKIAHERVTESPFRLSCLLVLLQTYAYKYLLSYVSAAHVRSRSSSISRTFSYLSFSTLHQPSSFCSSGHFIRWTGTSGQFINVGDGKAFCESERWKVARRIGCHLQYAVQVHFRFSEMHFRFRRRWQSFAMANSGANKFQFD